MDDKSLGSLSFGGARWGTPTDVRVNDGDACNPWPEEDVIAAEFGNTVVCDLEELIRVNPDPSAAISWVAFATRIEGCGGCSFEINC